MTLPVHEEGNPRVPMRYTLTETVHGHTWGVCAEMEGLFGEPRRGTYEVFYWVTEDLAGRLVTPTNSRAGMPATSLASTCRSARR
jgi:hypothetical protein